MSSSRMENIDIKRIMEILPHRYPFLLVDRIIELIPGEKITAIKNVTINEPFFQGHFPEAPVMPGVLILEALAQAGALMLYYSSENPKEGTIVFLGGIDKARFRRPVVPGDTLRLEISANKRRGNVFRVDGKAFVEDDLAAEAMITASEAELNDEE